MDVMTSPRHRLDPPRDWRVAMGRGARGCCPACGVGRMFPRFLKTAPACPECGEALDHHRADDLPAYLVIAFVGHLVVWLILLVEVELALPWPIWVHALVWPLLTLGLSLALIQPVKGAVIGLQWALRMHGFGAASHPDGVFPEPDEPHPDGRKLNRKATRP